MRKGKKNSGFYIRDDRDETAKYWIKYQSGSHEHFKYLQSEHFADLFMYIRQWQEHDKAWINNGKISTIIHYKHG